MDRDQDYGLLEAWRAGDEDAGNRLFRHHFASVHRFFRNKVGSSADDLTQRTFLGCVQGRDGLRGEATFRTYLFAVARNQLLMFLREKSRPMQEQELLTSCIADHGLAPPQIVVRHEEQRLVLQAMRKIPIGYQMVLELFYWEGMSVKEIGLSLDLSTGAVKTRLARGRDLLAAKLERIAGSEALLQSTLGALDKWARAAGGVEDEGPPEA